MSSLLSSFSQRVVSSRCPVYSLTILSTVPSSPLITFTAWMRLSLNWTPETPFRTQNMPIPGIIMSAECFYSYNVRASLRLLHLILLIYRSDTVGELAEDPIEGDLCSFFVLIGVLRYLHEVCLREGDLATCLHIKRSQLSINEDAGLHSQTENEILSDQKHRLS